MILWDGPQSFDRGGGITQSMTGRYLSCVERFRIKYIEGLQPINTFNHHIEYGNMWHICEENFAAKSVWKSSLQDYVLALFKRYPLNSGEIEKWYNICQVQFELYIKYWEKNRDKRERKELTQEQTFSVSYKLPSERVVNLRGKIDSAFEMGRKTWIQENKTKGNIEELKVERSLKFDMQSMFYIVAFNRMNMGKAAGILYNVIRRPLSGGKGSIRPHKARGNKPAEGMPQFYQRLWGIIKEDPEYFFMRWECEVNKSEVEDFEYRFLNPVLEDMCDDYEWWSFCQCERCDPFDYPFRRDNFSHHCKRHHVAPFGTYNVLSEGGSSDLDEYLLKGSKVGLEQTTMFPEL